MKSVWIPVLGGGGGNARRGDGGGALVFLREEPNGEIVGGKMGTCKDKKITKIHNLSIITKNESNPKVKTKSK